ncbi:MAG TPA: TolC family protein [Pirellulales bacterium]
MRNWPGEKLFVLIAAAVLGCAHPQPRPASVVTNAQPLEAVLPPSLSHPLPLSGYYDRQVGTQAEVQQRLGASVPPPAGYHALAVEQCQCLAVKASSEGNRLATERRVLVARAAPHGLTENERLKLQVLWADELEARNRSAAAALTAYYRIAKAEANRPILRQSQQEIDEALRKVDSLRASGLSVPFDDGDLRRKRLELADQRLEITSQLDRLNAELVQLIGASTNEARPRLWPASDFTVSVAPLDLNQVVVVGLATRPELRLLASLQSSLRAKTISVTRGVVGGPTAVAMLSITHFCKIIKQCRSNRRELPTRGRQLAERYDQRRREVTAEIQQSALQVLSKLERIAVEKELVASWRGERDKLSRKREIDEAAFVDVTRARLKLLEAESAETEQIIDWKIALVKLKESQGLLVAQCLSKGCCFLDAAVATPPDINAAEFSIPEEVLPGGESPSSPVGAGSAAPPPYNTSLMPVLPSALPLPRDVPSAAPSPPAATLAPPPPDMAVEPLTRPEP